MPLKIQDLITASTTQTLAGARASALGANLDSKADFHIIAVCGLLGDSVGLPVADVKLTGTTRIIRNNGTSSAWIWPPTGGAISDTTGSLGANAVKVLASNSQVELLCVDGLNYYAIRETQTGGVALYGAERYTVLTGTDRAILATESGKTLTFTKFAGETRIFTLPALTAGLRYRFQNVAVNNGLLTIRSTGANVLPLIIIHAVDDNSDNEIVATSTDITFSTHAGVGSYLDYHCDGTNWFVTGKCNLATVADVATSMTRA